MTPRPVGYYVHHQGAGHWARARTIAPLLDRPCTLIGTLSEIDGSSGVGRLELPDDRIGGVEGADGERDRPEALHYAPVGVVAIRRRMARIVAWIEQNDPVMMVVDVSVEVTLLARLLSVPSVVVRLAGCRTDSPHLQAFRAAEQLLAPFPAELEHPSTPDWVVSKTIYAGFLAARPPPCLSDAAPDGRPRIVVIFGRGGAGGDGMALAEAARSLPAYDWDVLGPVSRPPATLPINLSLRGWVPDVDTDLRRASLVIGTGGDGVIAAVAAHGKRFVCIPEDRPFDEQRAKAEALHRLGAAIHHPGWNAATDWSTLIGEGMALDPSKLAALADPRSVDHVVAALDKIAGRLDHAPARPRCESGAQNGRSSGRAAASISIGVGSRTTT